MAQQRHLANAPLTEALVDFRVTLPDAFDAREFAPARERLASRYPNVEERRAFSAEIAVRQGKPQELVHHDIALHGLFFKSADRLSIAQFRVDGFTFNRLKPYTSWEQILPEALDLWTTYVELARPEGATRLALRYINQLRLPVSLATVDKYLTAPPVVPAELPQVLRSFLTKTVVVDEAADISANVTQAVEEPVDPDRVTIILDIDTYKVGDFEVAPEKIEPTLHTLRAVKNRIFFGSITEETVRLYQ